MSPPLDGLLALVFGMGVSGLVVTFAIAPDCPVVGKPVGAWGVIVVVSVLVRV